MPSETESMQDSRESEVPDSGGRKFNTFRPGLIHDSRFYGFWKEVLGANEWVLDVLANGYEVPFRSEPTAYHERNNKSARDNMGIVKKIVADMILQGVASVAKEKPICVSPLGLVSKEKNGVVKHRLVWDASRHVNLFVVEKHVKLQHLTTALEITERDDFQCVFDLAQWYYHVMIRESQRKFLGADIENSDGSTLYFCYNNLPFGLSSAVHAVTKLWKPISRHLFSIGIRNSIFIDDPWQIRVGNRALQNHGLQSDKRGRMGDRSGQVGRGKPSCKGQTVPWV